MAATSVTYNGDGANKDFSVPFGYTSRNFVKAYVGGVITGAWTWLNSTTIRFTSAPPAGTNNVELRRVTSVTPLVDFVSAATITDEDLDLSINQMLDVLEENQNNSLVGMQQSGGNWDATNDRLVNLATPLASTDGANKAYVDSVIGSAADAAASAGDAAASAADALAQAGAAATSASNSAASAAAAAATALTITGVYPVSGMTANYVLRATSAALVAAVRAELKQYIGTTVLSGASVNVTLSGGYSEYELIFEDFQPATNNVSLDSRFSIDNAATFKSGASDYAWIVSGANSGGAANSGANTDNRMTLTPASLPSAAPKTRRLCVRLVMGDGTLNNVISGRGGVQRNAGGHTAINFTGEMIGFATRATHIQFFMSSGNFNAGNVLLYGISR